MPQSPSCCFVKQPQPYMWFCQTHNSQTFGASSLEPFHCKVKWDEVKSEALENGARALSAAK